MATKQTPAQAATAATAAAAYAAAASKTAAANKVAADKAVADQALKNKAALAAVAAATAKAKASASASAAAVAKANAAIQKNPNASASVKATANKIATPIVVAKPVVPKPTVPATGAGSGLTQAQKDANAAYEADQAAKIKKANDEAIIAKQREADIASGKIGSGPNGEFVKGDPGYQENNNRSNSNNNNDGNNNDNLDTAGTVIGTRKGSKDGTYVNIIADGKGGYTLSEDINGSDVIPGSTGTNAAVPDRTLAEDTFSNTFALAFGSSEASQSYVKQLYKLVSGYYKSGSGIDDSLNLALHEAKFNNAIPDFTKRFAGLFALQAKAQNGQAVQVPTIAEFIAAENGMGVILRSAGMGDLATQDYLGQIIGQGKSVHDVATAINTSFAAIDNAPQAVKDTLASQFPSLDRTTLAKSLLMGVDGAAEIQKKIDMATTVTAAAQNKMTLSDTQKQMLSTSGLSYGQQLQGLGYANLAGQRGQTLTDIYGKAVSGYGQDAAIADQFQGLASAQRAKTELTNREIGTFNGQSGTMGPSYGTPRSSFNKPIAGQI